MRTVVEGWDNGSMGLSTVATLLRQAISEDPVNLKPGNIIALRLVLRCQPSLQNQGLDEDSQRLMIHFERLPYNAEVIQELKACKGCVNGGKNKIACALIGYIYFHLRKEEEKSFKYYSMSANLGFASAQNCVASSYEQGDGVDIDKTKAHEYFFLAIAQGEVLAMYNMANIYMYSATNETAKADTAKAVDLYRLASDQGFASAQCKLGQYYCKGSEVECKMALELFKLSLDKGPPPPPQHTPPNTPPTHPQHTPSFPSSEPYLPKYPPSLNPWLWIKVVMNRKRP